MKAAIVVEAGKTPVYGDFREPIPAEGEVLIHVRAAALSHLTKGRAAGTHYSSDGKVPFVVGIDGVGRLENGKRVYFVRPDAPWGAMSERTVVRPEQCVPVPDDLDDVTAAAIANPGMSVWAAFRERAKLVAGENVLINGATGSAGRLAVQVAKYMGAKKVVATGRNAESLKGVRELGADVTIPLGDNGDALEDALKEQFGGDGIDVVLDYLWGPSAERILIAGAKAGKEAVPIRYVEVGALSAANITLPGAALRSSAIQMMGSGIGSVPIEGLLNCIEEFLKAVVPAGFQVATKTAPLADVGKLWAADTGSPRLVFLVG